MPPTPNIDALRRHIEDLTTQHEIALETRWIKRPCDSHALREREGATDEIHVAPITTALRYATALHEIGHILGRYQDSERSRVREQWAWTWARANALIWTPAMERCATQSLSTALRHAPEADADRRRWRKELAAKRRSQGDLHR